MRGWSHSLVVGPVIIVASRLGVPPCGGNIFLRSYSLEKAFCSGKDLLESCARQIFVSWRQYHAPMICGRANPQLHLPLFLIVHTGDDFDAALEQIELFRDRHPDGRIAIVADHYRLNELTSAFRAGASGYFVNVITCDRFIRSVELVMMGETIFPPAFLSFILDSDVPTGRGRGKRSGW